MENKRSTRSSQTSKNFEVKIQLDEMEDFQWSFNAELPWMKGVAYFLVKKKSIENPAITVEYSFKKTEKEYYAVKDSFSQLSFFVKTYKKGDVKSAFEEKEIFDRLKKQEVWGVLGIEYIFKCDNIVYMILPAIQTPKLLNKITAKDLSVLQWMYGLRQLLACFLQSNTDTFKFTHGDFHQEQMVFCETSRDWYLIDFGNARIEWEEDGEWWKIERKVKNNSSSSTEMDNLIDWFEKKGQFSLPGVNSKKISRKKYWITLEKELISMDPNRKASPEFDPDSISWLQELNL